jgi:hypothetical protein
MSDEVRDCYGRRIIPPAELPPGAIGWNIHEYEPAPLGEGPKGEPEFIGFIPAKRGRLSRFLEPFRRRRSARS